MAYNVKSKTDFTVFDGPEAYHSYISNCPARYGQSRSYNRDEFYGDDLETAKRSLANGHMKYLERAQALIDKMADANVFASHQPQLEAAMVGFVPNVPAALAGQPYDMWNITQSEEQAITTPINIYVETLVSGGVSQDELIARGVCVMAFVLAMNNIRPVELYTICIGKPSYSNKSSGVVVRVPSKPLDIQRAGFMLCDPAYYRRLAFMAICEQAKVSYNDAGMLCWPWDNAPTTSTHEPMMRELLDMDPEDVFIPGGYLFDELMRRDPVQWVKNKIKEHTGSQQIEEC